VRARIIGVARASGKRRLLRLIGSLDCVLIALLCVALKRERIHVTFFRMGQDGSPLPGWQAGKAARPALVVCQPPVTFTLVAFTFLTSYRAEPPLRCAEAHDWC
jgi:hypothetical protein